MVKLLKWVDKNGFKNNTIVIFTNDNGPVLESMSKPFMEQKNTTFEGGVRVPCLVRWPEKVKPGSENNGLMFVADWFPTFKTLAGSKSSTDNDIDGIDMADMLFNGDESVRDFRLFSK